MKGPIWIILSLLLTSPFAYSQQEDSAPGEQADAAGEEARAATEPAAAEPEPDAEPESAIEGDPAAADRSPFDYRASEQISEDLSVSFPVDI